VAESGLKTFWSELRRRKVVKAAIVYVVVAWLLIQIAEVIFEPLKLPDWSLTLVIVLAALGFPLALVLAWAFELSPDGLQRDKRHSEGPATSSLIQPTGEHTAFNLPKTRSDVRRAIAVLPLTNMSGDPENEYFSDGISEELLNLLAKIPELRVISRTSAFSFKNKAIKVADVARELNVAHVLEGSVRKAGDRVRITAQLIRGDSDSHLWSETYDRTLEDIFAVQDEIAATVVQRLKVTLLGGDPHVEPTDPRAYTLRLQARHLAKRFSAESYDQAIALYEQALAIDPDYVEALGGLANIYINQANFGLRPPQRASNWAARSP